MDSKSQRNGVQDELKRLREKHLAKNQRDKLKEMCMAPLTTPEEAKTFLATMREAQQKRERLHRPPSNLNADGMDAWFLRQRKEEQQMRNRRREAETIWRNYRGAYNNGAAGSGGVGRSSLDSQKSGGSTTAAVTTTTPRHSSAGSEHGTDMPSDPNDT